MEPGILEVAVYSLPSCWGTAARGAQPSTPNSSCCHYSPSPVHHTSDECLPTSDECLPTLPLCPTFLSLLRGSPSALFLLWPSHSEIAFFLRVADPFQTQRQPEARPWPCLPAALSSSAISSPRGHWQGKMRKQLGV